MEAMMQFKGDQGDVENLELEDLEFFQGGILHTKLENLVGQQTPDRRSNALYLIESILVKPFNPSGLTFAKDTFAIDGKEQFMFQSGDFSKLSGLPSIFRRENELSENKKNVFESSHRIQDD